MKGISPVGWLLAAGCLLEVGAQAQQLHIPAVAKALAKLAVGQGQGTLSVNQDGTIKLTGHTVAPGQYTVNWYRQAAVLDYWLPHPVSLPENSDRLSLSYNRDYLKTRGARIDLRTLVGDHRGGRWAVGTRFGGSNSQLGITQGFEHLESYAWSTSELGRRDPWVMTSLDPARFGAYTGPQAPLELLGFRVVVEAQDHKSKHDITLTLRDVRSVTAGGVPDPYWLLLSERLWNVRMGNEHARYGRFGWGPDAPGPFLKAADLKLAPGAYRFAWEILAADDWRQLASRSGVCNVASAGAALDIDLPLLNPGSYHLRLLVSGHGQPQHEFFMKYVVLRNGHGASEPPAHADAKPLRCDSNSGTDVFPATGPASLTIVSNDSKGTIRWQLQTTDRTTVAHGDAPAAQPLTLDLASRRKGHTVLWLRASLQAGGQTVDVLHRVVGFRAPVASAAPAPAQSSHKLDALAGKLCRCKGDWSEGSTPIGTFHKKLMTDFAGWLDEARETGYNTVELPAPWFEINPLPGVYEFRYLDALVAAAKKRGLYVTLRLHPSEGLTPAWVPRQLMEDRHGLAHGLWSGANNLFFSPAANAYRAAFDRYAAAVAAHYRADPKVLGVTIEDLFFDHDLQDQPWLGEYVDYSEAMRQFLVGDLRAKYGNLAELGAAYGRTFRSWEEVTIPRPAFAFDDQGRLLPRTDPAWRDWIACKIRAIREFRLGGLTAARQGDPRCYAALYASPTLPFYWQGVKRLHARITYGSMGSVFPPTNVSEIPGRFEPIQKIARTATLVDVGMSNVLLAAPPGFNSVFNYWQADWRIATRPAPVQAAEHRLHQWFEVVDRVVGAAPIVTGNERHGLGIVSTETLLLAMQHTFTPRMDDYLKPFRFAFGRDKVQIDTLYDSRVSNAELAERPYVYVPYCADVLPPELITGLKHYVEQGGRLVLDATGGYRSTAGSQTAVLLHAFGLPGIKTVPPPSPSATSESGTWTSDSPLHGVKKLAFRIRQFDPPINEQPTPWIQNIARCYLQPNRFAGKLPAGARVLAIYADGTPAATLLPVGKGQVLFFTGIIDWLDCPGLAAALDDWGHGRAVSSTPRGNPDLIAKAYRKGSDWFAVGRRFIGQEGIRRVSGGHAPPGPRKATSIPLPVPEDATAAYHVQELLEGQDLGLHPADALRTSGVSLSLRPGEAFLLEAKAP